MCIHLNVTRIACENNFQTFEHDVQSKIHLIKNAVSLNNGDIAFYPFELKQYDNMGASSLLQIDFNKRPIDDPDYGRVCPKKEIVVKGIRADTFMSEKACCLWICCALIYRVMN